jgi:hypothetical protein
MTWGSGWAAIVAALSILLIAVGFASLRGASTPVDVGTVVERFRAAKTRPLRSAPSGQKRVKSIESTQRSATGRTAAYTPMDAKSESRRRPIPAEGVYVYATTGGDDVDVLGGSRHTYPAETTITVSHGGCGFVERWDALAERWDERESCQTPQGDMLRRTTSYHEFFGHGDERTLVCDGFTYPAAVQPGSSWTMRCASENTTAVITLTAVGFEDVDVAGTAVRCVHVRAEEKIGGEQDGTGVRDVWGSEEFGIEVRERSTLTSYSNQPVFGRTRYHESYEIRLNSLEPRR